MIREVIETYFSEQQLPKGLFKQVIWSPQAPSIEVVNEKVKGMNRKAVVAQKILYGIRRDCDRDEFWTVNKLIVRKWLTC